MWTRSFPLATFVCAGLLNVVLAGKVIKDGSVCTVAASSDASDDAPAILQAFQECGNGGSILMNDEVYHVESVMNTTELSDVYVELTGTLLWGTNITYWRESGIPLNYQNQTTAWAFGGKNVTFDGKYVGTFDGNGQLWYDFTKGVSNLAGRPISLMIVNTTDSYFTGLRFVQSQFWTLAITHVTDSVFDGFYINSTSHSSQPARNTDGVDTFYSDNLLFKNFTIVNGDDNISMKANSTNILIQDSTFYGGLGVAIGSIGQYPGVFERIENITAERIVEYKTRYSGYLKTWTGVQQGVPPNGGGGGLGYAKNITFRDFELHNITDYVAGISQCTTFSGAVGMCDTSLFQISDITWGPFTGNVNSGLLGKFQCSGAAPCPGLTFVDFDDIMTTGNRSVSCRHVTDPEGFTC